MTPPCRDSHPGGDPTGRQHFNQIARNDGMGADMVGHIMQTNAHVFRSQDPSWPIEEVPFGELKGDFGKTLLHTKILAVLRVGGLS